MSNKIFMRFLSIFFLLPSIAFAAIFDCFMYFNEAEVCRIRLEELYPVVDRFIIVEYDETYTGHKKAFNFLKDRDNFQKFADKISYFPLSLHYETNDPWCREAFQRGYSLRVYSFPDPTDLILMSDLDEIPKATSIQEAYDYLLSHPTHSVVFIQTLYRYYINRESQEDEKHWRGTTAILQSAAKKLNGYQLRWLPSEYSILNGGWHFSSMVPENYNQKLSAYSHTETDTREYRAEFIERKNALKLVPIDETYPLFIQQNLEWV